MIGLLIGIKALLNIVAVDQTEKVEVEVDVDVLVQLVGDAGLEGEVEAGASGDPLAGLCSSGKRTSAEDLYIFDAEGIIDNPYLFKVTH